MFEGCFIMKYLPDELKKAYEYDLNKCHPIEGLDPPLIGIEDVLQAHYILADYFTDSSASEEIENMLVGLRNEHLLASALSRQTVTFCGKTKYTDPIEICATLFFGLVKDHAFNDGNKRTALLVLLSQLYNYGYYPKSEFKNFENLVLAVADSGNNLLEKRYSKIWKKFKKTGDCEIKTISYIIRHNCEKKDRSFHKDINMREFCGALDQLASISYKVDNMKIKFERKIYRVGIITQTYKYSINFYGWTRPLAAGAVRDVFNKLHLIDEFPSFDAMFSGAKPLYKMINQFEIPFRRLKDE